MKKDKDGNWEFEYDTAEYDSEHSDGDNETLQNNSHYRPGISGVISSEGQSAENAENSINLVC